MGSQELRCYGLQNSIDQIIAIIAWSDNVPARSDSRSLEVSDEMRTNYCFPCDNEYVGS